MRTSQIKLSMEFMDSARTDYVCNMDASKYGEREATKYLNANSMQYYVSINTWLSIIDDAYGRGTRFRVTQYIYEHGLRDAIDLSCRTADHIISWLGGKNPGPANEDIVQWESLFPVVDIRTTLTCLRFLKRFTIDSSSVLEDASYDKFISIQEKLNWRKAAKARCPKDPDVSKPTNRWIPFVYPYISDLLSNWQVFYQREVGEFGNGSCSDGVTYMQKITSYGRYAYNRGGSQLYPVGGPMRDIELYVPKVIEVNGVPKSYKAYRIIAPETAYGSYYQQRLRKAIIDCAKYTCSDWWWYIDVESQDRQKDRAYAGSLDGEFCTYDLSGASDSIALYWMDQLLRYEPNSPLEELWDCFMQFRAPKVKAGKVTTTLSSFLTSGNACTFIMETIFFWSLAMVAADLHADYTNEICWTPSVFGDDLIVDYRCSKELESILADFDLTINFEKSFSTGEYRESCGVEFWKGQPVHSRYWPRARILTGKNSTAEDYASLVALQHKVYDSPQAALFIEEVVLHLWPTATKSSPGIVDVEESTDLWSAFPTKKLKRAPYGAYWKDPKPEVPEDLPEYCYREAHSGLRSVTPSDKCLTTLSPEEFLTLETWLYAEFLMYGPQYSSPLDELLGVSEPRSRAAYVRKPDVTVALLT